ncbi:SH3 domain-containing protein [Desulfobacterales bacterium HSG2]|nr:SH3 domain-containing protein [Desulfobacterales bacterium HSG2]
MKTDYLCWKPKSFTRIGPGILVIVLAALASCLFTANMSYGFSPKTERIKTAGNLHEKPEAASSVIAELQVGDEVTLILRSHEWYIVKLSDNRLGWAHENLLWEKISAPEKTAPKETEAVAATASPDGRTLVVKVRAARVREMPSVKSGIEYGLKKGDMVSLIRTEGDWHFVRRDDGSTGWAHKKLFQESDETESDETGDVEEIEIKDIQVDVTPDGEEKVVFVLTGFSPPETFVLEDNEPKVVCDFFDARFTADTGRSVDVNAKFIQRIRIGVHKTPKSKVRVVLDLVPDRDYEVEQTFFRKENFYTLTFKSARE